MKKATNTERNDIALVTTVSDPLKNPRTVATLIKEWKKIHGKANDFRASLHRFVSYLYYTTSDERKLARDLDAALFHFDIYAQNMEHYLSRIDFMLKHSKIVRGTTELRDHLKKEGK